jgi:hypothetical protein
MCTGAIIHSILLCATAKGGGPSSYARRTARATTGRAAAVAAEPRAGWRRVARTDAGPCGRVWSRCGHGVVTVCVGWGDVRTDVGHLDGALHVAKARRGASAYRRQRASKRTDGPSTPRRQAEYPAVRPRAQRVSGPKWTGQKMLRAPRCPSKSPFRSRGCIAWPARRGRAARKRPETNGSVPSVPCAGQGADAVRRSIRPPRRRGFGLKGAVRILLSKCPAVRAEAVAGSAPA